MNFQGDIYRNIYKYINAVKQRASSLLCNFSQNDLTLIYILIVLQVYFRKNSTLKKYMKLRMLLDRSIQY